MSWKDKGPESEPQLVIVDIMMPGIDGREVARRLRADSRTKDLPVLAATVPFTLQQLKEKLDKFSHLSASPK